MNPQCERQEQVLEIARSGGWAERCGDELLGHVAQCETCAEIAAVASAIAADVAESMRAPIPPSGAVWWRMQRRQRFEAETSARRIITALQASFVVAGAIGVAIVVPSLPALPFPSFLSAAANAVSGVMTMPVIIAVAAFALVTPVALVVALRD